MSMLTVNVTGAVIGKKVGMSRAFLKDGTDVPVTIISICENLILSCDGEGKMVLGFDVEKDSRKLKKPQRVELEKRASPMARNRCQSSYSGVTNDGGEKVIFSDKERLFNYRIDASGFVKGAKVSIRSTSLGKGFCGVIKRHGFAGNRGEEASCVKRSHGSTGQRQDPGKVFKNKKMAGRDGYLTRTVQNLEVMHVDGENGLIAVKGCVPGAAGVVVKIYAAKKYSPHMKLRFGPTPYSIS